MPTFVEVDGFGEIEFPDEMSVEQIQGVLQKQFSPQQQAGIPGLDEGPTPEQQEHLQAFLASQQATGITSPIGAAGAMARGELQFQKPEVARQTEAIADDSVDPMFGVSEDEIQRAITDKDRGVWGKINEPRAHIPRIPQQEGALAQIGAGTVNAASGLVESLTSDLGIALLPLAAAPSLVQKAVGLGFGAHLVKSGAGGIASAETLQQGTEAAAGTALGALMIGHGGTRPGTGGAGGKAARAIDPTSSFAKPIDYTFDPETNIVRTEAGPVKITPEGPRTLTETEIKSQEALGKEVKPLPKDPQLAKAEETLAELDKQGEVPTLAELEASQVGQRAQLEQDFPTKPSPIKGPAVRTAEGVREGKLGQTHAELKLSAAQEGLDFTEGEHIFKDAEGNELTRVEAWQAAKENGQLNEEGLRKANQPNPELESQDLLLDLPGEARRLKLEQVDPDTYQRIEDETILPDHVAFKDPKTNQLFQIPNDATQADLVEILGAVRGEEAAVRTRAELEARTQEVTSRGAGEPPVTTLPVQKASGKYPKGFEPPDRKVREVKPPRTEEFKNAQLLERIDIVEAAIAKREERGEPVFEEWTARLEELKTEADKKGLLKPVTSPEQNIWKDPERLQEWLNREVASGTFGKKGSAFGPTKAQAKGKATVEARIAKLNELRTAAKESIDQSPEQMKPPSGEKGSVNLDLLADAGRTFYRKGMEFVEWSRNVLKGLGEKIKPYLSDLWKRMQSEEGAAGGSGGVQRKLTPKQQIQTTIMGKVPLTLANAVSKMTALKERLRGMQEGSKIGALEQRKQVRAAEQELAKNYEEVRKDLIEFSQNLPLSERAKFTNRITTALKPISSLYHKPEVIFDRAEKVVNQITAAVYDVNRKAVIGKIETLLEKNEASKTLNVPQKQAIRLKGEQFNRFKDTMSLDMLETMQERMQEIRSLGKDLYALDEVMKEQRVKATLREITTQGTRKVDAPEQLKLALGETEGWWAGQLRALKQAPASALQRFNLALTPIDWMVQTFDQKMGGAIRRTMKLPIDIKHGDYLTKRQAYKDPLRALAKKHKLTAGNLDRITAHAELRQEGGLENLEAHGFSQKEINSVKTLKRGELEFLRESDRILNELKPMIKAVSEGYFHQEVTDVPGYWPRQRDWSHYESLSIEQGRYGKINRSKPEAGFIQERTGAITYNRMNALEIMEKHIDDAIYHVEMGPEIARIAKVVRSKEFAESTGTAGQRFFSDWVDVLARNGGVESARRSKAIDILVRNTGLAQLALRVTTTGLQPLSIIQGMAVVSPKNMGKAITLMARKDYREFILNNFPEIKNRVGDDPAYASYGGKGVKDTMARAGFYGISRLDRLSAMATGLGAYMDGLETAGLPFDRNKVYLPAMQEAQLAVRKTQSSALPKDVSLAQSRGNLTNSKSLDAALTQFQSFMISKWALTKNGALQLGIKEKSIPAGARIMGFVLLGTIAEQMARDGIRRGGQAIFGQTDQNKREEKQDKKEGRTYEGKILEKAAVDLATSMPVLSNIHGVIRYDGTGIPVVDVVGKTAAGAAQAYTGKKPSTRTKGALRAVQGAGALMGVPTGQIGDFAVQYVDANKPKKER